MKEFLSHLIEEFHLPLQNPVLIFSLVLFIILLSPILLRKLNIPGIIGLIISGVLIGPYGFNILENNVAIKLFSTIGLLYIMFIAGLELDLNQFKINRNKSLMFGFLTFIIPLGLGYPICHYLLGYNEVASFLTASMFSTHTLVAYPIISKLGVSKNQAVAVAVGGTILTDTAVLILLAVIIGSSEGSLTYEFWWRLTVSLLIFSGIMFFIIPKIARWFFRKLESEKHSHYIFVLSVVFFSAFLAEVAGVEPIIGAFVAGLSLNKLIPHSSTLMNRVEFIGNSLFIPFFLISVGMLVNVRVLLNGNTALIVAGALTTFAIFSKWIAAFITQRIYKFSAAQRQLIFGLSSAHAAATLAIILVGFKAGILDENILNGTIILILVTCVVASFVAEKAAKQVLLEQDQHIDDAEQLEKDAEESILIPNEGIGEMQKILDFAILVKEKKSANPISVLSIVSDNAVAESNIKKMHAVLEGKVNEAAASDAHIHIVSAIDHNIASGMVRKSREILATHIFLTWPKKQGLVDMLMGDDFHRILDGFSKTLVFCHFPRPMVSYDRVTLVIPAHAEHEIGFSQWMRKVNKLVLELSLTVSVHCSADTQEAINHLPKSDRLAGKYTLGELDSWESFHEIGVQKNDLLIFVAARKGAASYAVFMEHLPDKIEKQFSNNGRILIYPDQFNDEFSDKTITDYTVEPLKKGIDKVQKVRKGIDTILKRKKE